MSDSFKKVDFDKSEDEILDKLNKELQFDVQKREYLFDREKFDLALETIEKIIEDIKHGNCEWVHYTPQIDQRSPVFHSMAQLRRDPWPDKLRVFLQMSRQDFGQRVEKEFTKLFEGVFEPCQKK